MRLCDKQLGQLAPVEPSAGLARVSCIIVDQFQQTRAIVPWRVNLVLTGRAHSVSSRAAPGGGEYSTIQGFPAIKALTFTKFIVLGHAVRTGERYRHKRSRNLGPRRRDQACG